MHEHARHRSILCGGESMKVFITGGTGFIGQRVIEKLVGRGHQVAALTRSQAGAAKLEALGAVPAWGDITERESLRAGMAGCEAVFHLAAWYKLGSRDWEQAERLNVGGTRNVLGLAHELGIPKIIYTSTVAVYGDTHGQLVDENYQMPDQPFLTEYDRTKWAAHYEVALPLIQKGAPIVILLPGAVYGPGDVSLVGQLMRSFYRGWMAFFPGPETLLTYAHVEDIAEGHLLALEKGQVGECYNLTGPVLYSSEAARIWAAASGRRPPLAYIPARFVHKLEGLARFLGQILPMPEIASADAIRVLGSSYIARADKAAAQLGWQARPAEIGFRQTLEWIAADERQHPCGPGPRIMIAGALLSLAVLLVWKANQRQKP